MHTTLDERAVMTDPRVTEHARRTALLKAVYEACELDGLAPPMMVDFRGPDRVMLRLDEDQPNDVDAWAVLLGQALGGRDTLGVLGGDTARPWVSWAAKSRGKWHGYDVEVWAVVKLTPEEVTAFRARQSRGGA